MAASVLNMWPDDLTCDEEFIDDFYSYAARFSTHSGCLFRLVDDSEWHCLLPWESFEEMAACLAVINSKNPNILLPFPQFERKENGLNLKQLLFHPITFALVFFGDF
jgi:hypothetical protein